MFEAQYLFGGKLVGETWVRTEVYSPWMPRGGDNVIVTLETIAHSSTMNEAVLAVSLFHKNSEETGPGTAVSGSIASRTAPGIDTVSYEGVKELVRYKYACTSTVEDEDDYVLFRMLALTWFDDVEAP